MIARITTPPFKIGCAPSNPTTDIRQHARKMHDRPPANPMVMPCRNGVARGAEASGVFRAGVESWLGPTGGLVPLAEVRGVIGAGVGGLSWSGSDGTTGAIGAGADDNSMQLTHC